MKFGIARKVNLNVSSLINNRKTSSILQNNLVLKFKRNPSGIESAIFSIRNLTTLFKVVGWIFFIRMWNKKQENVGVYLDFFLCQTDVCRQKRHTQWIRMSARFESIFKSHRFFFIFTKLLKNIGHRVFLCFSREKRRKLGNPKFYDPKLGFFLSLLDFAVSWA